MQADAQLYICPLCGERGARLIPYPAPAPAAAKLGLSTIAVCSGCGLGAAVPLPDQPTLDRFYRSGAYWEATSDNSLQQAHEKSQAELRVQYCLTRRSAPGPISVLDVGAGHGYCADWLEHYLPRGTARYDFVEPDERNAARILRTGASFPVAQVESLGAATSSYDLIFLNHVLEHVADPVATVKQVAALLTAPGCAYVETPHADHRYKDDVFPHTWFFTVPAFEHLARRAGVEQICCESFGRWIPERGASGYWRNRMLRKTFTYAVKAAPWGLQRGLDRAIWRYEQQGDGIWLRWLVRRRT